MEFAMLFKPYYSKDSADLEEGVDEDAYNERPQGRLQLIQLQDRTKMSIRTFAAVVRFPHFVMETDPENYFYSLLLQYVPFRSEAELLCGFNSAKEAFLAREEQLRRNSVRMEEYRQRDKALELAFTRVHALQMLEEPDAALLPEERDVVAQEENTVEDMMTDEEFELACRALNSGQRDVVNRITRSIQDQLAGGCRRERLFITGGAGTGKTFLLKVLKNQIDRCYGEFRDLH